MNEFYKEILARAHDHVCTYCKVKGHIRPRCTKAPESEQTVYTETLVVVMLDTLLQIGEIREEVCKMIERPTAQKPFAGWERTGMDFDDDERLSKAVAAYLEAPSVATAREVSESAIGSLIGTYAVTERLVDAETKLETAKYPYRGKMAAEALAAMLDAQRLTLFIGLYNSKASVAAC